MRKSTALLFVVLTFVLTGCSQSGPGEGIDAVGNWGAELDLRVGSLEGEDALTLFRSLTVDPTGNILTLHPMEQAIRVTGVHGSLLRTIGGRGDGPGEFQNAGTMGWRADTLWVLDYRGYEFNLFTEEGEFLSSFSVPFEIGEDPFAVQPPRVSGLLHDGTPFGSPPAFSHLIQDGTMTEHVPMLMNREGEVTDTLPAIPFGRNQWAIMDPDDPRHWGTYQAQPFADGPLWGYARDERAVLHLQREAPAQAEGATYSLTKLSFAGDTLFSREYPFDVVPVDQTVVDSILEAAVTMLAERRDTPAGKAREWAENDLYVPQFKSPIGSLVLGQDGTVWLAETGTDPVTTTWLVLDAAGEKIARVGLPSGFRPIVVDEEYAWGSETDELDVPFIVRYRIVKPG